MDGCAMDQRPSLTASVNGGNYALNIAELNRLSQAL